MFNDGSEYSGAFKESKFEDDKMTYKYGTKSYLVSYVSGKKN